MITTTTTAKATEQEWIEKKNEEGPRGRDERWFRIIFFFKFDPLNKEGPERPEGLFYSSAPQFLSCYADIVATDTPIPAVSGGALYEQRE